MSAKVTVVGLVVTIIVGIASAQDEKREPVAKGTNWVVHVTECGYLAPFERREPLALSYYSFGGLTTEENAFYGVLLRAECIEAIEKWAGATLSDPKGAVEWTKVESENTACKNVMVYAKHPEKGWVHQHAGNVIEVQIAPQPKGKILEYVVSFQLSDDQKVKLRTGTLTITISDFLDLPSFALTFPYKAEKH